jgi:hypothetical protein
VRRRRWPRSGQLGRHEHDPVRTRRGDDLDQPVGVDTLAATGDQQEDRVGAVEGRGERGRIGQVGGDVPGPPHPGSGTAGDGPHLVGAAGQQLDQRPSDVAGGPGDHDRRHAGSLLSRAAGGQKQLGSEALKNAERSRTTCG